MVQGEIYTLYKRTGEFICGTFFRGGIFPGENRPEGDLPRESSTHRLGRITENLLECSKTHFGVLF